MIIQKEVFCHHIENLIIEGYDVIDAVLKACEEFDVDPAHTKDLINKQIKEKLRKAYEDLNYIKKQNHRIV